MTIYGTPISIWIAFNVFILAMLALDLGVFHRKQHEVGVRESLIWTAVWVAFGLAFGAIVWWWKDALGYPEVALQYLTGYVIEKSLSVDNIFVFLVIFRYFHVRGADQHKVLFWGIIGALVLRAVFIFAGVALIDLFDEVLYLFGAFLIFTGLKLILQSGHDPHPEKNPVIGIAKRVLPLTHEYHDGRFSVRIDGRRVFTPLMLVLIVVETTDVVFALDSIPAILAISKDPFIVFTSNVFAILGLRALYFALAGMMNKLVLLHYGLGAVLAFVGAKMIIEHEDIQLVHIPVWVSLLVVVGLIGGSVIASLLWGKGEPPSAAVDSPAPPHDDRAA